MATDTAQDLCSHEAPSNRGRHKMTTDEFERFCRNCIVDETNRYLREGNTATRMAAATGLSLSTIRRLADGGTAFPRLHTVLAVLEFFGYSMSMQAPRGLVKNVQINELAHSGNMIPHRPH